MQDVLLEQASAVYKDMYSKEEYRYNRDCFVQQQNTGDLLKNHSQQTACESDDDSAEQKVFFCAQCPAVRDSMHDCQEQKQR